MSSDVITVPETEAGRAGRMRPGDMLPLAWLVVKESARSFVANRCAAAAATLAYYGFLALMPLLLLVVFSLSLVMRSSAEVLDGMEQLTANLFPVFGRSILDDLLALSRQRVWGLVSLVVLVWSITPFAGAVRDALFGIFRAESRMRFWKAKLFDVAAVLSLLLLFLFVAAGRVLASVLPGSGLSAAGWFHHLRAACVFLLSVAVLVFFYKAFAPVALRIREAIWGALGSVSLFAVMRPLFGLVLEINPDYGYAFGSMKAIFLLIIWVYYTFAVLLLGAELIAAIHQRDALLLRGLFHARRGRASLSRRLLNRFLVERVRSDVLFREGEAGTDMFHVLAGEVSISRGGRELATLKGGEYFGEMSMLLGAPRSATATVVSGRADLVRISMTNFETILREEPDIVKSMLKKMAARLEATNRMLEAG